MNDPGIIHPMSEGDTLLALQAARATLADDMEGASTAMEAMSTEGLELLIALLKAKAEQRGIEV